MVTIGVRVHSKLEWNQKFSAYSSFFKICFSPGYKGSLIFTLTHKRPHKIAKSNSSVPVMVPFSVYRITDTDFWVYQYNILSYKI